MKAVSEMSNESIMILDVYPADKEKRAIDLVFEQAELVEIDEAA
jgi:hypothetical protein